MASAAKKLSTAGMVGLNCPKCGENINRALVARSHPSAGGQFRVRYCPRCHEGVESLEVVKGCEANVLTEDITDLLESERRAVRAVIREFRRLHGTYDEYTGKLKREQNRRWGGPHEPECDCIACEARKRPTRPAPMFEQ